MTAAGSVSAHIRLPQFRWLDGRRRIHLSDGPIDLIIEANGPPDVVERAYAAAYDRLTGLLDELCAELPQLRSQVFPGQRVLRGSVASRMEASVLPYARDGFITPMAAVAGSVADTVLAALVAGAGGELSRAFVNNGGDIALHLTPGTRFVAGLVTRPDQPSLYARTEIAAESGIRGIATSGAPGRSFSFGIADAVTVLAATAAEADAAATVIANAVDLPGDPRILRRPANALQPDSDLGERLVTCHVPPLTEQDKAIALDRGRVVANRLVSDGRISGTALYLQGATRFISLPLELSQSSTLIEAGKTSNTLLFTGGAGDG